MRFGHLISRSSFAASLRLHHALSPHGRWRTLNLYVLRLIVSEALLNLSIPAFSARRFCLCAALGAIFVFAPIPRLFAMPPDAAPKPSPLIAALKAELERSMKVYGAQDPAAYFISYTLTDTQRATVSGSNGALLSSDEGRNRWLEVAVRTGSYELDNTHKIDGRQPPSGSPGANVPIDDDPEVLRRAVWLETDTEYRSAAEALIKIKTGKEVKVQTEEGAAPDFSREKPQVYTGPLASFSLDRKPWEQKVRDYTRYFRESTAVINSIVTFTAQAQNQIQVNSEGTQLQFGQVRYRLELFIQGKASDGMDINRYYNFDWTDSAAAPDDKTVLAEGQVLRKELEALTAAPLVEPYAGPALLTGRATAVFFHEVFGHRAEGFRQKDINEGQTFARKVGEQILPSFLSIYDDPTSKTVAGAVLIGFYPFDDEGTPAERVTLVDKGILRNFEMRSEEHTSELQSPCNLVCRLL